SIAVKVGDKVSQGSHLIDVAADVAPAGVAPPEKVKESGHTTATGAPAADYGTSGAYETLDVRVPDIGDFKDVPVIDVHVKSGDTVKPEDSLITLESDKATMDVPSPVGGTIAELKVNVGCIPSKALLHTAAVVDEATSMGAHGITFGKPQIDIDKLRGFKDGVVKKLTGGLAGMAKARKVEVVRGVGRFLDPYHLQVELTTGNGQDKNGEKKTIRFQKAIIAAGSQAVKLPFIPDDPRVVDSTGALE